MERQIWSIYLVMCGLGITLFVLTATIERLPPLGWPLLAFTLASAVHNGYLALLLGLRDVSRLARGMTTFGVTLLLVGAVALAYALHASWLLILAAILVLALTLYYRRLLYHGTRRDWGALGAAA